MPWYAASTAIAIISDKCKNQGCRDDTITKTVVTRKHWKVGLRACNNLPQTPKQKCREGVAEDCCKTEWTGPDHSVEWKQEPFSANSVIYLNERH